jgi:hypothetical protein
MTRRYDTTPTQAMREAARSVLDYDCPPGSDPLYTRLSRTSFTLGYLSSALNGITEVDDPETARNIARARAQYEAFKEAK